MMFLWLKWLYRRSSAIRFAGKNIDKRRIVKGDPLASIHPLIFPSLLFFSRSEITQTTHPCNSSRRRYEKRKKSGEWWRSLVLFIYDIESFVDKLFFFNTLSLQKCAERKIVSGRSFVATRICFDGGKKKKKLIIRTKSDIARHIVRYLCRAKELIKCSDEIWNKAWRRMSNVCVNSLHSYPRYPTFHRYKYVYLHWYYDLETLVTMFSFNSFCLNVCIK